MSKYKSWNGGCDTCLCLFLPEKHENFPSLRYQHDSVPSGLTPVYPRKSVMASSIRDPRVNDKGNFSLLLLYSEMNTIMDQLYLSQQNLCVWQELFISVDTDKFVCSFSTLKFILKIINLSYLMSKIAKHPYPLTGCRFQHWLRKADSETSSNSLISNTNIGQSVWVQSLIRTLFLLAIIFIYIFHILTWSVCFGQDINSI